MASFISGCSGGDPNLSVVNGTVKAKGEPVLSGEVMFYPTGGGRPAVGLIGPDGRYELTSFNKGDGVTPGRHKVTINANKLDRPNNAPSPTSVEEETAAYMDGVTITWLIPKKYSQLRTTTLTAEVAAGQPNEINFDSADFE